MRDDLYHPHYPSTDKDYFERLTSNASKMANPIRLMCSKYTPAEEIELAAWWAEKQKQTKR